MQDQGTHDQNPRRPWVWGLALLVLATPWVAMQFTEEVSWQASDFIVFALMLALAVGAWELGTRLSRNWPYRLAWAILVLACFLLTWANLAVGIIGNAGNPVNRLFFAIPIIAAVGGVLARFRPRGMVITLLVMALYGWLVTVGASSGHTEIGAWVFTVAFTALCLAAAWLFRKAQTDATGQD
jgi:hypothetical protein